MAGGAAIEVAPARTRRERLEFIRFPYRVYRDDPCWVAPLELERLQFLDRRKNAWFDSGEVELLLARRGGEVVGRIAAVEDRRYNEHHGVRQGVFGMMECVDDREVAAALFDAAQAWTRARGLQGLMGPAGFSSNYEWAVLVDGFGAPPAVMMPYNPRYYPALYEACGFARARDLLAWDLPLTPPGGAEAVAERLRRREGIRIRPVNVKDREGELRRALQIYNGAWSKNWGFVPMSDREFRQTIADLERFGDPELVLIAEVNGEPAGLTLLLPDFNEALAPARGRLFHHGLPVGLFRVLWGIRRIRGLRFVALGVQQKFRKRGLEILLVVDVLRVARRLGYQRCEVSWTLENNDLINRATAYFGATRTKTYRVYQRP